jgi:hypothetical protein
VVYDRVRRHRCAQHGRGRALDPAALSPSTAPAVWPTLPVLPALGLLLAALPAIITPRPPATYAALTLPDSGPAVEVAA